MNKFFSLFLLLFLSVSLQAQTRKFNVAEYQQQLNRHYRSVADTLVPLSFINTANGGLGCASATYSVDITNPVDSGYVSGTNIYGDLEKAQRYFLPDFGFNTVTVDKLIAHFSIIHQSGSVGLAVGKIYTLNAQGMPDSLIATSIPVSISSISVIINGIAEFDFLTPVTVSNGMIAAIDFGSCLSDTLALVHTEANCFDTTGSAWEKWSDSTWHSFNNTWQFESDLAIFPVLSDAVPAQVSAVENNFEPTVFPNPCNGQLFFNLNQSENEVRIFNALGAEVYKEQYLKNSLQKISTENMPTGFYSAVISDNLKSRVVKFVVQH